MITEVLNYFADKRLREENERLTKTLAERDASYGDLDSRQYKEHRHFFATMQILAYGCDVSHLFHVLSDNGRQLPFDEGGSEVIAHEIVARYRELSAKHTVQA